MAAFVPWKSLLCLNIPSVTRSLSCITTYLLNASIFKKKGICLPEGGGAICFCPKCQFTNFQSLHHHLCPLESIVMWIVFIQVPSKSLSHSSSRPFFSIYALFRSYKSVDFQAQWDGICPGLKNRWRLGGKLFLQAYYKQHYSIKVNHSH